MKTENQWNILKWRLEELADKALQEELWLGKIPGKMSDFTECICGVFDDSGLSCVLDRNAPVDGFSSEMHLAAQHLDKLVSKAFKSVGDRSGIDFIRDPRMDEIRVAAESLRALLPKE
jgi:hypothetical protein